MAMFQAFGVEYGFTVVHDQDGSEFNSLANLQQYDVVVFSNTSGNAILDPTQQANFEAYMDGGGAYLGIHAASDTYRHSSANGNNTGTWDYYPELMGASVQEGPNHVSGTPTYAMGHIGWHVSTAALPNPWLKAEEYYYWENGYFGGDNTTVLEVEETIGPNGMVNSYDAARSMSWFRELPGGGRVFYTALGHATSNFTSDSLFMAHNRDALLWTMDLSTAIPQNMHLPQAELTSTPFGFRLKLPAHWKFPVEVHWITAQGAMVKKQTITSETRLLRSPNNVIGSLYVQLFGRAGRSTVLPVPIKME